MMISYKKHYKKGKNKMLSTIKNDTQHGPSDRT